MTIRSSSFSTRSYSLRKGLCPEGEHVVPLGKADIKRKGKDLTIITYSRMTYFFWRRRISLLRKASTRR